LNRVILLVPRCPVTVKFVNLHRFDTFKAVIFILGGLI